MRIVIDEYGGVAGLVTIEDLLEADRRKIRDEHEVETAHRRAAAVNLAARGLVPGQFAGRPAFPNLFDTGY